ncbi:MAG TPA: MFS transporter [Solirubrobacteraceae bacterium]|nr:MFS transporter [Solirubrobacteraceae bacterium]
MTIAGLAERRWIALGVVCLGQLMMILDATIVTVALPAIRSDLRFTASSLTWVPNAYLISFGSLLLLGGRLGDLLGRRRAFLGGMVLFTLASLACGLAQSQGVLIAARFVQGVGAAVGAAAILALIVVEFPEPAERVRAMAAYAFVSVAGGSIGLLAGGVLTQGLSWHWIFYVNVPFGVLAYVGGRATLVRDRPAHAHGDLDVAGSALVTAATMIAIYAIVGTERHGFGSARTLGLFAVALAIFAGFAVVERRAADPILPMAVLRTRSLLLGCFVRAFQMVGIWSLFFVGAQFLQQVLGWSPIAAGAAFLPQTLTVAALSLGPTARLIARFGARVVLVCGLAVLAAGLALFAVVLGTSTSYLPWLLATYAIVGIGGGASFMTVMALSLEDVPAADAGVASGMLNVAQQISGAFGLAVIGTLAAHRVGVLTSHGDTMAQALSSGYRIGFLVAAGSVAVATLLAAAWLRWLPSAREAPATVAVADA